MSKSRSHGCRTLAVMLMRSDRNSWTSLDYQLTNSIETTPRSQILMASLSVIGLLPNKTHSDLAGHGMRTECVTRAHHTCSALRVTRELLFLNRDDQSPRLACTHPLVEKIVTFIFCFACVFHKQCFFKRSRSRSTF